MRGWRFLAVATIAGLAACGGAPDDGANGRSAVNALSNNITNFHVVNVGLYRGARPDDAGLADLKSIGVKTVVDLEINDWVEAKGRDIAHEKSRTESLGMTWVHYPMSAFAPVDDDQMMQVVATLSDPAQKPIFVHCLHGQDRTGLAVGLERVRTEGWDPQDAHDEMLTYGFHKYFLQLNHYFEEKTGWEG